MTASNPAGTPANPTPLRPDPAAHFDPKAHLSRISGAEYLEVKWRLVWFRRENPAGVVDTTLVSHDGTTALFKAFVSRSADPAAGQATGWGSETKGDFRDYVEKAETKAIGRALAALGYGTQFCDDFSDRGGPISDAPVTRPRGGAPARNSQNPTVFQPEPPAPVGAKGQPKPASDAQKRKALQLATHDGPWSLEQYHQFVDDHFGGRPDQLDAPTMSKVIDSLVDFTKLGKWPETTDPDDPSPTTHVEWNQLMQARDASGWSPEDVTHYLGELGCPSVAALTMGQFHRMLAAMKKGAK